MPLRITICYKKNTDLIQGSYQVTRSQLVTAKSKPSHVSIYVKKATTSSKIYKNPLLQGIYVKKFEFLMSLYESLNITTEFHEGRVFKKKKNNESRTRIAADRSQLTIFPDAKINAVVFGSLILMITAAKRCLRRQEQLAEKQKYFYLNKLIIIQNTCNHNVNTSMIETDIGKT